ncbi:MAG TPA: hypothetical protein DEA63_04510 [Firmicutes bacterium]|nr:hypothetical protein [Bacillota bacterium]
MRLEAYDKYSNPVFCSSQPVSLKSHKKSNYAIIFAPLQAENRFPRLGAWLQRTPKRKKIEKS